MQWFYVHKSVIYVDLLFICCKPFCIVAVGTRLMGSRSVACIASETLSSSDEEQDVILSLTEMVSLSRVLLILKVHRESHSQVFNALSIFVFKKHLKPICLISRLIIKLLLSARKIWHFIIIIITFSAFTWICQSFLFCIVNVADFVIDILVVLCNTVRY